MDNTIVVVVTLGISFYALIQSSRARRESRKVARLTAHHTHYMQAVALPSYEVVSIYSKKLLKKSLIVLGSLDGDEDVESRTVVLATFVDNEFADVFTSMASELRGIASGWTNDSLAHSIRIDLSNVEDDCIELFHSYTDPERTLPIEDDLRAALAKIMANYKTYDPLS